MIATAYRIRLVGVSFCHLLDLVERTGHELVELDVVRDRDNTEDLNAVEVRCEGRRLGWIPWPLAERMAPGLDAGVKVEARLLRVAVDLEHRPGVDVRIGVPE